MSDIEFTEIFTAMKERCAAQDLELSIKGDSFLIRSDGRNGVVLESLDEVDTFLWGCCYILACKDSPKAPMNNASPSLHQS